MTTITSYRYGLDKTSKKFKCTQCGQKRFVRCIDFETSNYLPDHVGRCDREHGCGYEYTWNQWLKEQGSQDVKPFIDVKPVEPPKPVNYLPIEYIAQTIKGRYYSRNNLLLYLVSLFGDTVAHEVAAKYLIGTSNYWKGANIYWQIDESEHVRQCKIMLYNPTTGKRVKEGATVERLDRHTRQYVTEVTERPCSIIYGKFLDSSTKDLNLEQCFYGQHLLIEYPEREVCIVESEKTALIASVYLPQFNWLSTGGASGCKWREYAVYKALKGKSVTFFPDYGVFNKKANKTCYQEWCERVERIKDVIPGKIRVSDVLERRLADQERNDQDLADLLVIKDETTSLALTEAGYPVMWDYKTA